MNFNRTAATCLKLGVLGSVHKFRPIFASFPRSFAYKYVRIIGLLKLEVSADTA